MNIVDKVRPSIDPHGTLFTICLCTVGHLFLAKISPNKTQHFKKPLNVNMRTFNTFYLGQFYILIDYRLHPSSADWTPNPNKRSCQLVMLEKQ